MRAKILSPKMIRKPRSLPLRKLQHYDEDLNRAQLEGICDVSSAYVELPMHLTEMLCIRRCLVELKVQGAARADFLGLS